MIRGKQGRGKKVVFAYYLSERGYRWPGLRASDDRKLQPSRYVCVESRASALRELALRLNTEVPQWLKPHNDSSLRHG